MVQKPTTVPCKFSRLGCARPGVADLVAVIRRRDLSLDDAARLVNGDVRLRLGSAEDLFESVEVEAIGRVRGIRLSKLYYRASLQLGLARVDLLDLVAVANGPGTLEVSENGSA